MELETLAQELAVKNNQPVEVCRAGLLIMAASIGKAVGMQDEKMQRGIDGATQILRAYYAEKQR